MRWKRREVLRGVSTAALLLASGCFGGKTDNGQTGSPFAEPPSYQSGTRFRPDLPGGGGDPGGAEDPGTRPDYYGEDADDAGFSDGHLVLYAEQALQIIDVSSDGAPMNLGALSLPGYLDQLEVEDGMAWLVLRERAQIDSETIPQSAVPEYQSRLIAVDLSDPESPQRVASVDLEARFWSFERRGRSFYVIEELTPEVTPTCGPQPGESGRGTAGMQVRRYDFSGESFESTSSEEIPTHSPYSYYSADTLFVSDLSWVDFTTRTLSWIEFSEGSLESFSGPTFDQELNTVIRAGDYAFALDSTGLLTAIDLEAGTKRGAVELGAISLHLLGDSLLAALRDDGEVVLVDVSEPAVPVKTASLAETGVHFVATIVTPEGLVTLGRGDDRSLSVLLWDLSTPSAAVQLAQLTADYEFPERWWNHFAFEAGARRQHTYDEDTQTLLVPVLDGSHSSTAGRLLSISVQPGGLELVGDQVTHGQFSRPLEDNTFAYELTSAGLEKAPFAALDSGNEALAERLILSGVEPLAQVTIGEQKVTLWEREPGGQFFLRLMTAEGESSELELPHGAEHLIEVEGRAVAISTNADEECFEEGFQEQLAEGSLACAPFRNPGLSVVDVTDGISLVDSFEMPVVSGAKRFGDRGPYFALPDGRLIFPSVFWSGGKTMLQLTALSDVSASPSFEVVAEAPGSHWVDGYGITSASDANVLFSETGFGFVRQDWLDDDQGESQTNAQGDALSEFYLSRFTVLSDGSIRSEPPVSTPGVPILWRQGQLLSVEPGYDKNGELSATLHTSRLENNGAFIQESQVLSGYYRDVARRGDFAYLLLAPKELCPDVFFVDILPTQLGPKGAELYKTTQFPFGGAYPGRESAFLGEHLRIQGGPVPGAAALYDVSDPDELRLIRYATDLKGN